MNLIATSKHPYESEGATITASGFAAQMLLDRGYALNSDEPVKVAKVASKPIQKPKTKKK